MQGIRVPIALLDPSYKLSTAALSVIISLYDAAQSARQGTLCGYEAKVRMETLAARCRISVKTVSRCLSALACKGLISGRARTARSGMKGTYVYSLPRERTYAVMPRHAFRLIMEQAPCVLKTYLYCLNCAGSSGFFYHSFSDIAASVGKKRSDVMRHITLLEQLHLIKRRRKHFLRQPKRSTENTYIVYRYIRGGIKSKQRAAQSRTSTLRTLTLILKNIIHRLFRFVKSLFEKTTKKFLLSYRRRCLRFLR